MFVLLIVITVLISISSGQEKKKKPNKVKEELVVEEVVDGSNHIGVIKKVNTENKTIEIFEHISGQDITVYYTGASDFRDKFEQVKTVYQFTPGKIVEFNYDRNTSKLYSAQESDEVWEYSGVNQWNMDISKGLFQIVNSNYQLSKDVVIYRGNELITLEDLDVKDELYVRGDDREILSIGVSKGHGTISFVEYADFIGGIAYIGKREVIPITENMVITAREGIFDIVFEKGDWRGQKSVTLLAEDRITVSMEEFKKPPVQMGTIDFNISPMGADLLIDNEEVDHMEAVQLEYGNHSVKVTLGGYTTYEGKLVVGEEYNNISIRLVENKGTDEEAIVEVESGTEDNMSTIGDTSMESVTDENKSDEENNTTESDTDTEVESDIEPNEEHENGTETEDKGTSKEYIHILTPEDISVYFDGDFMGNSPVSFPKELGTHYITFIKEGYQTQTYTVQIEDDGKNTELNFPSMIKNQ